MKSKLVMFGVAIGVSIWWVSIKTGLASTRNTVTKELRQTYPLTDHGHLRVDNINGKIRIIAWDRPEIEMVAVKRADTEADLDDLEIEIHSTAEQFQIHTKNPRRKWSFRSNHSASVDYELKVPVQAGLDNVQNVNGSIEISGVQGKVHASTVNGRLAADGLSADAELGSVNGGVQAAFDHLEDVRNASIKTVNGRVRLTLPEEGNAEVSAHTLNGSIHSGPDLPVKKKSPVGTDLHGTMGKGGAQIKAETVNGAIQIVRAESK